MEFTHQNLNKNIGDGNKDNTQKDRFKEFLSFASVSSNQNIDESIRPVEPLDFSHFEEAVSEPEQPPPPKQRQIKMLDQNSPKRPQEKPPQQKA